MVLLRQADDNLYQLAPVTPVRGGDDGQFHLGQVTPMVAGISVAEKELQSLPHSSTPATGKGSNSTARSLTAASSEKKPKGQGKFSCSTCTYKSSSKSNVMRHERTQHGSVSCVCNICNKQFRSTYYLKQHLQSHVSPHVCEYCSMRFTTKNGLKFHIKKIHLLTAAYECPVCNKSYVARSNYEGHINAHRGYKPFRCSTCNKCFSYKSSLNFHTKHCSLSERYSCATCNTPFRTKTLLAQHTLGKHSDQLFTCSCGKTFRWKTSMLRHQRQHNCK